MIQLDFYPPTLALRRTLDKLCTITRHIFVWGPATKRSSRRNDMKSSKLFLAFDVPNLFGCIWKYLTRKYFKHNQELLKCISANTTNTFLVNEMWYKYTTILFFFTCLFYQLLGVQHSCSSTQSWGSVLPSIVQTGDQHSWVALLFLKRNLGIFFVHRGQKSYTPTAFGRLWNTPGVKCMKHASS